LLRTASSGDAEVI